MRYYGGGIGHLKNALPEKADSLTPSSGEVAALENEEDDLERGVARDELTQDVIMHNEESEVDETHDADDEDEDRTDPENYDLDKNKNNTDDEDEDEDEEGTSSSDEDAGSGYASP